MRVKHLAGIVLILTHAHSGMDVDERAERDDSLLLLSAQRPCCLLITRASRLFRPNRRPKSPLISFILLSKVQGILSQITGINRLFHVPFKSMESHQANGALRLAGQAVSTAAPGAGEHCSSWLYSNHIRIKPVTSAVFVL